MPCPLSWSLLLVLPPVCCLGLPEGCFGIQEEEGEEEEEKEEETLLEEKEEDLPTAGLKSKAGEETEVATAGPSKLELHSSSCPNPTAVINAKPRSLRARVNGNVLLQPRLKIPLVEALPYYPTKELPNLEMGMPPIFISSHIKIGVSGA